MLYINIERRRSGYKQCHGRHVGTPRKRLCLFAVLLFAALLLLSGCAKKESIQQPEFPLSEEALSAALEERNLPWTIEETQTNTKGSDMSLAYSLHIPGMKEGYNGVNINTFDTEDFGRRLQCYYSEPYSEATENGVSWEQLKDVIELITQLYGGFDNADAIYKVCSAKEIQKDELLLFEGTIRCSGIPCAFVRINTYDRTQSTLAKVGNTVQFQIYEGEDNYLHMLKLYEEYKSASTTDP